jgi:hypothetical protein
LNFLWRAISHDPEIPESFSPFPQRGKNHGSHGRQNRKGASQDQILHGSDQGKPKDTGQFLRPRDDILIEDDIRSFHIHISSPSRVYVKRGLLELTSRITGADQSLGGFGCSHGFSLVEG